MLFGFIGNIINWLTEIEKDRFLEQEGETLIPNTAKVDLKVSAKPGLKSDFGPG